MRADANGGGKVIDGGGGVVGSGGPSTLVGFDISADLRGIAKHSSSSIHWNSTW